METGLIFVVGVLLAGQAVPPRPMAEKVELCEVARSGPKYAGHTLELTGTVLGQDQEHLLLTSPGCMLGVRLAFSQEVRGHDDVRILFAALKRSAATPDRAVSGSFEGTYLYSDDAQTVGLQVTGIDQLNFPKK